MSNLRHYASGHAPPSNEYTGEIPERRSSDRHATDRQRRPQEYTAYSNPYPPSAHARFRDHSSQEPLRQSPQHKRSRSDDIARPSQGDRLLEYDSRDDSHQPTTALPNVPADNHGFDFNYHPPPQLNTTKSSASSPRSYRTTERSGVKKTRRVLGLRPAAPIADEHDEAPHSDLFWSKVKFILREPFAEFWGTFILVLFGDGAIAQVLLSTGDPTAPGGNGFGSYQSINWGYGLGLMMGIYVAGDSGAYLNPALTFCNCLYRQLPWRRLPLYVAAQLLGGFCAAGVIYGNYISAIDQYEGGNGIRTVPPAATATAGIFATYPQPFMTRTGMFFSEALASAILMFVIFALKDNANMGSAKGDKWFPLALFFLMFGIGACFGWETGFALNMARDFGPRLMTYALGYGTDVWTAGGYYFWIPIVAPFIGATGGGFLYDAFLYTGESPVNTPWIGLKRLVHPREARRARKERMRREKDDQLV